MLTSTFLTITIALLCAHNDDTTTNSSLEGLIAVVSDPAMPHEARIAAEHALMGRGDPEALRLLLPQFNRELLILGIYGSPGLGPEGDAYMPPGPQVRYALDRLWRHFAQNAQPDEKREEILLELFEEYDTKVELHRLIGAAAVNPSEAVEEKLWSLFSNRDEEPAIRSASVNALVYVAPRKYSRQIVELAWEERGSEVAMYVGGRFGGPYYRDPKLSVLKLDWYGREVERAIDTGHNAAPLAAHMIDSYFGNVSGMYRHPHARLTKEELEQRDKRLALMREARETGDDTKLREFEAQIAERQRAELEQRVEIIDAWIEANRERLEREATEYARQRERERQRER